jgi:hypothetical protein
MSELTNPYAPDQPCRDPRRFFGRAETFAFVRQALHSEQTPILIGGRGMGKTSLLWQLPFQLEARYLTVYLDLAEPSVTRDLMAFVSALIETARQALRLAEPSLYLPDLPAERDAAALWAWFARTHLTPICDVMRRFQRLIYCFDNAQALISAVQGGNLPADLIESLSALRRDEPRIGMVFAFDAASEPQLANYALFSEPLNQQRLLPLSDAEAAQLIAQPSAPFYTLSAEVIEALLAQSGGHPYLLEWLCALLWENAAARNFAQPPDLADVDAILPLALQACSARFAELWQAAAPSEQAALTALAALTAARRGLPVTLDDLHAWLIRESERAPHSMTLAAALRSLEYRGMVRAVPSAAYTFSSGLLYLWLQPQAELPRAPESVARTSARRAMLPIALTALATIGAATLIAALASAAPRVTATAQPTQTLALNLEGTQRALSLTQTFEALPTATATWTATATPSVTATATFTATATATRTFTVTPSATATASLTATATFTATATVTRTFTATPSATATASLTATPTHTATITPSLTATATASATHTATATPSAAATLPILSPSATPLP